MNGSAPAVGDTVGGKYVVEELLGRGGMGAVYRARHAITDRAIALKLLLPDADYAEQSVQRFLREAKAMGRIDHANVVGVLDFGSEGASAWLAMELLRGRSLRSVIGEEGRSFAPADALALLLPAMEGVAAAHRVGVVHRDLKPENLFVVEDEAGRARTTKVLDFGISKVREDATAKLAPITQTGTTMGTPSYMAPEQVRGAKDVDARADVWSLAVILYELLTGRTPFLAETYGGLMVAICMEPHVPIGVLLPDVPRELSDVIDRALAKDPGERFPDVPALARALEPFAVRGTVPALPPPPALPRLEVTKLAGERPSATPTRHAKGGAPERPISTAPTGLAPALELESHALRAQPAEARPARPAPRPAQASASSPLPVADVPIHETGLGSGGRTKWIVAGLAVATLVPIVAVVASEALRPARVETTSTPPAATVTAPPVTAPPPIAAPPAPAPAPLPPPAPTPTPVPLAAPDAGRPAAIEDPAPAPARAGRPRRHEPEHATEVAPPAVTHDTPATAAGRTGSLSREEF